MEIDVAPFQQDLYDEVQSTRIFDDTLKTLERLKTKYRLFCLSNLATPYKAPYFEFGLDQHIEKPFFSCDLGDKKPNASFFNMVIEFAGVGPQEAVMIGDNPVSDYSGALNAGIQALLKNKSLAEITAHL